jgi:glycosyltransferase involved in cell wall biosynthesis
MDLPVDVSILIPTYRRPALLELTLGSLLALRPPPIPWEILVIDNCGDRDTQRVLGGVANRLPIRLLTEPRGSKNRALLRGLEEAAGDLVVFTDDDVVPDAGWLTEIVEGAGRWPDHAVFGGRVLPLWPAGRTPSFRHAFFDHAYAIADWAQPEGPYPASRVYGPNMAIRASVFREGWSFDPAIGPDGTDNYLPGGETDLTMRLERAGLAPVYLPRALVLHQIRAEQLELEWLFKRAFRKGREDLHKKGAPAGPRLRGVPVSLLAASARAATRRLSARFSRDPEVRFDRAIAYWKLRGMMHQCRVSHRPGSSGAPAC